MLASFIVELPSQSALTRKSPVTEGIQTAMNSPSESVFTSVRLSQDLPPVTLYETKIDAPRMAVSFDDNFPWISTLRPPEVAVPLHEREIVGVVFDVVGGGGEGVI